MPQQYLSPGVYVEEVSRGARPIEAVGASVAAFVGLTERRPPAEEPRLVTSWTQYQSVFGGFAPGALLPLAVYGFFLNGGGACYVQSVGASAERLSAAAIVGDREARTGLGGLEALDDAAILAAPDLVGGYMAGTIPRDEVRLAQQALVEHCERLKSRVAILDTLPDLRPEQARAWRAEECRFDSSYAALYYPWIWVANPLAGQEGQPGMLRVPPSGHIAGVWARSDAERGVHKAPANEPLRGAVRLETSVSRAEQDALNPAGVNCIRAVPGGGVRVWGARTLSGAAEWRYVNVRRLFTMVEQSIERGTQWVVFEPNDPELWARVRRDVTQFLTGVWRSGALFGQTAGEAFFVKCDAENNPPEEREQGRLIIDVGIAPVRPAEFVVFRIGQIG